MSTQVGLSIIGVLASLVVACAQPSIGEQPSTEFAGEGLHEVKYTGFDRAFVHPDAGLSGYSAVTLPDMHVADVTITQTAVAGTARSQWLLTPEREQNLQALWRQASARAFRDYGDADGAERALIIESTLTEVAPGRTSGTGTTPGGAVMAGSADSVDVSVEFRVYDRDSKQLLAVIRDRDTVPVMAWISRAGLDMSNQFNRWAGLLSSRLKGR